MKCSSSRLTRIITGAPTFLERMAGMMAEMALVILLPKPPPVYSLMTTILLRSGWPLSSIKPSQRAIAGAVCAVLWVEQCTKTFPFCQYAMAVRVSSV